MKPRLLALALLTATSLSAQVETTGGDLYRQYCAACHGQEGLGIPQAFPPLARSDFIANQRERALRAPLEGLKDKIEVNGQTYQGWMPPVTLRDEDLAKVFNYVCSSWGNAYAPTSAAEIAALRTKTTYPTYEKLLAAMSPDVLPPAPSGWKFSVAAYLDFQPTRLTPARPAAAGQAPGR